MICDKPVLDDALDRSPVSARVQSPIDCRRAAPATPAALAQIRTEQGAPLLVSSGAGGNATMDSERVVEGLGRGLFTRSVRFD